MEIKPGKKPQPPPDRKSGFAAGDGGLAVKRDQRRPRGFDQRPGSDDERRRAALWAPLFILFWTAVPAHFCRLSSGRNQSAFTREALSKVDDCDDFQLQNSEGGERAKRGQGRAKRASEKGSNFALCTRGIP